MSVVLKRLWQRRPNIALIALAMAVAALVGVGVTSLNLNSHTTLICCIFLVLAVPTLVSRVLGRAEVFSPIVIANWAMMIMFAGRPLALLLAQQTMHDGYDIMGFFDHTLVIALCGSISLEIGYYAFANQGQKQPVSDFVLNNDAALVYGNWFAVIGVALYGLFVMQSGGLSTLSMLLSGRSPELAYRFASANGFLYAALPMCDASALICFAVGLSQKQKSLFWLGCIFFCVAAIPASGTGTRIELLPALVAPFLLWYLNRNRRPKLIGLLVLVYLVGAIAIPFLREARAVGTNANQSRWETFVHIVSTPGEQFRQLLLSADTEMFDTLDNEMLIVPSNVPFQPGASLKDVLVRMVPRAIWPSKPMETSTIIDDTLWHARYANGGNGAATSILGVFYLDSGITGVCLGMFLTGIVLALLWRFYQRYQQTLWGQMVYAMSLPYVIIFLRGTVSDTFARMLFTVVPLVLLKSLAARRNVTHQGAPVARGLTGD